MNKKRPRQLIVRLTEDELRRIKKQVRESGLSQQEFVRLILLDGNVTNTDVIPELKRIGNNINQITRRCNSGYPVFAEDLKEIRKEVDLIWRLLKLYLPMQE